MPLGYSEGRGAAAAFFRQHANAAELRLAKFGRAPRRRFARRLEEVDDDWEADRAARRADAAAALRADLEEERARRAATEEKLHDAERRLVDRLGAEVEDLRETVASERWLRAEAIQALEAMTDVAARNPSTPAYASAAPSPRTGSTDPSPASRAYTPTPWPAPRPRDAWLPSDSERSSRAAAGRRGYSQIHAPPTKSGKRGAGARAQPFAYQGGGRASPETWSRYSGPGG